MRNWKLEASLYLDSLYLCETEKMRRMYEYEKAIEAYKNTIVKLFNTYKATRYIKPFRWQTLLYNLQIYDEIYEESLTREEIEAIEKYHPSKQKEEQQKKIAKKTVLKYFDILIHNEESIESLIFNVKKAV